MKTLRGLAFFLITMAGVPLFSQAGSVDGKINPLYDSVAVVQRLSYDNFKSIKLLYSAVVNFGGGQAEFDKLVDGYATASSYYFSRDFDKAADAFTKNEKDIKEAATRLAQKYQQDTIELNREIIKYQVNARIKQSLTADKQDPEAKRKTQEGLQTAEIMMKQSSESLSMANDELVRAHPVQAIALYRRSKDNSIMFYEALGLKELKNQKLSERFAREKSDNKNKIYIAKEKKN
jgi:hypothetical protein